MFVHCQDDGEQIWVLRGRSFHVGDVESNTLLVLPANLHNISCLARRWLRLVELIVLGKYLLWFCLRSRSQSQRLLTDQSLVEDCQSLTLAENCQPLPTLVENTGTDSSMISSLAKDGGLLRDHQR